MLIKMKLLPFLSLVLLLSIFSDSGNSTTFCSWEKLEISPKELCSVPYGDFRVNVYEHYNNNNEKVTALNNSRKKYYYAPIALLDHKSAVSIFNNVTNLPEMRFRIEMWNEELERKVVNYLSDLTGEQVKSHQVQVIPFEKVVLARTKSSIFYSLSTDWLPYQLQKSQWFSLSCFVQSECNKLADNMKSYPQQFENFNILFSLTSRTSQTKQVAIRFENIVSSQMVNLLLQRYEESEEIFLSAKDEKRLLKETTANIIADSFDDFDVISSNSETQIYNLLKSLLVSSRTTIGNDKNDNWGSVFWNDDNNRPDKMSKYLNDIYVLLSKESQIKLSNAFSTNGRGEVDDSFDRITIQVNWSSSSSSQKLIFIESRDYVEWNGEKFVPKPMLIGKINLGKLRDTQTLQDRNLRVRYSSAVFIAPINFYQNADLFVTDEFLNLRLVVANLTTKLERLELEKKRGSEVNRFPASCSDLQQIGHTLSGLYNIIGSTQVETVFCNFIKPVNHSSYQTLIGYADVKSTPTYFYVQRSKEFRTVSVPILFDVEKLNIGGAMNTTSGIFTAPKTGKYFFATSGIARFDNNGYFNIDLKLNGDISARAQADETPSGYSTFALESTLSLKMGDKIWLEILQVSNSYLFGQQFFHFTGWLIEEDFSNLMKTLP